MNDEELVDAVDAKLRIDPCRVYSAWFECQHCHESYKYNFEGGKYLEFGLPQLKDTFVPSACCDGIIPVLRDVLASYHGVQKS